MGSSHLSAPAVTYFGIKLKMNKLVLCGAVLLAIALLLPTSSAQETSPKKKKSSSAFLDDLCAKCKYCKTDPECSGCAKCSECNSRRERRSALIDARKDAEFVEGMMVQVWRAVRREIKK